MLKEKLMKKLEKKGRDLDPNEKKAKLDVIKELRNQASEMMGGKIHPMKKVTVASDSEEGLKAGLKKAEDVIEHMPSGLSHPRDAEKMVSEAEEEMDSDLDKDNAIGEHSEEESEDMSPAEAEHEGEEESRIAELEAELKALKEKQSKKA